MTRVCGGQLSVQGATDKLDNRLHRPTIDLSGKGGQPGDKQREGQWNGRGATDNMDNRQQTTNDVSSKGGQPWLVTR